MSSSSTVSIEIKGYRAAEHLAWIREPQYFLLVGCGDSDVFRKLLARLQHAVQKTDSESRLDNRELWQLVRDFLLYPTASSSPGSGESGRRQLARRLMLQLGMIETIEQYKSAECGADFHAADIGVLTRTNEREPADHTVVFE